MTPSEITDLFNGEWNLAVNKLVMLRQDQGFFQQDMANATGRCLKTISSFENGKVLDPVLLFGYRYILEEKSFV